MKTNKRKGGALHPNTGVRAVWLAAMVLLGGCGGGGSHSTPLSYAPSSLTFVVGTAITPVVPTASQSLSSFTVTPALPGGLSLNAANGTISGTPTAATPAATYTVSASGGGASATASVSITVNPQAPSSVSYGSAAFTFTTNVVARALTPSAGGGTATTWSINPALPAGLTLDAGTGAISGTPTTASAAASYVVTAQNSGGNATVTLTIEVDDGPLLDLGHASALMLLRMSGSSVLSVDYAGHWVLWNYTSAAEIASGDLSCGSNCNQPNGPAPVADMAGDTVVLVTQNGFEVRSATTGDVLSEITASAKWWTLASDGSYLAAGSSSGLSAWSPSGSSLASLSGNYSTAVAFADPGEIQVAEGPAGQSVIETDTIPGGASTPGPAFNGQFSSWFVDGSRFITTAGSTALVYSQDSVQQAAITLPGSSGIPVGQGNWIWTLSAATLDIFAVATGSTPAASFNVGAGSVEVPSATTIAVELQDQTITSAGFSIIDLSGATPTLTHYTLPNAGQSGATAYAASSASQWMVGNTYGVLVDGASLSGTPRYFDYGAVSSIAGSNGSIAVATASGRIVYFDASTLTQEGEIPYPASTVLLSSDGTVLAAAGDTQVGDYDLNIYSLPSGGSLYAWPYSLTGTGGNISGSEVLGISLSGSGAVLGQIILTESPSSLPSCTQQANPTTGGSTIYSSGGSAINSSDSCGLLFVSPDGTLLASSTGGSAAPEPNPGTNIVQNGTVLTAVTGSPSGWIDDGHLLINTFAPNSVGVGVNYAGCTVYSPSGQSTGSCALPEVYSFQAITSDSIYAINLSEILSVSTGDVSWMSGDSVSGVGQPVLPGSLADGGGGSALGAIADNRVIFVSGAQVLAQGY